MLFKKLIFRYLFCICKCVSVFIIVFILFINLIFKKKLLIILFIIKNSTLYNYFYYNFVSIFLFEKKHKKINACAQYLGLLLFEKT